MELEESENGPLALKKGIVSDIRGVSGKKLSIENWV